MERIDSITLCDTLPLVFSTEEIPPSEVWKSQLTFTRGETYQVEAASGGGKSSMLSFIYGARRDYSGSIRFNGDDIRTMEIPEWQEIRRSHLAYLPQDLMLFPELTALENIQLKNRLTGYQEESRIKEWMERLGITFRKDNPAGRCSVGQQQRIALVRALCQPFDFILLDEPVSHLDERNNREAAAIIMEEASRQGAGIISTSVGNPLSLASPRHLKL